MEQARNLWNTWSPRKRVVLIGGVACILLLAGLIGWWTMRTRYETLFAQLRESDAAEIATALDALQVPHRFADEGSTLLVPADAVYDTRMKLVAQGIPHGGSVGFETFKDADFGVTEFSQRVNYQRAIQGELERTISAISEVASVRVHLTLRRAGMFEADESPAKASVTLATRPDRSLTPRQVAGIQKLVASAVDGLQPEHVAVIGAGGVPLSSGAGGAGDQGEEQARVEGRLRQRVDAMLRETLGDDAAYSVSVDVRLNYDRVKQVSDRLLAQGKDGNGLVIHQKNSSTHAAPAAEGDPSRAGSGDAELDFAHGREQEEIERAPGRVERISIGVLVPYGTDTAVVSRLATVISAATGLDTQRGDRLDIAAVGAAHRAAPAAPVRATSSPTIARAAVTDVGIPGWDAPWWVQAALGVTLVVAMTGVGFAVGRARRRVARLTLAERERLLADVQTWIGAPEQR
jgi:flagellar M-ring protein FliF